MTKAKKPEWVRLPNRWVEEKGLRSFRWSEQGSAGIGAMMMLVAIAHGVDQTAGLARITYDQLQTTTGLSRTTISAGLAILERAGIVMREGKSVLALSNFEPTANYAKLPVRRLYDGDELVAFRDFTLRHRAELDAMKLYLLFASRRDRHANITNLSYEKIGDYAAVEGARIKHAVDLLVVRNLVRIDQRPSQRHELGMSHGYRLTGLDAYIHAGTRGRSDELMEEAMMPLEELPF